MMFKTQTLIYIQLFYTCSMKINFTSNPMLPQCSNARQFLFSEGGQLNPVARKITYSAQVMIGSHTYDYRRLEIDGRTGMTTGTGLW